MAEFVCKKCGAVVRVPDDAPKAFCNKCGFKVYDAVAEQLYDANPLWLEGGPASAYTTTGVNQSDQQNQSVQYSAKTFDRIQADNANPKTKTPILIILVICAVVSVIAAVFVVGGVVVKPSMDYNAACELMGQGNFVEAINAFEKLDDYKDSPDKVLECKYELAKEMFDKGEYDQADVLFVELNGYSDSKSYIDKINFEKQKIVIKNANVGDIVQFGTYEQDNDYSNGSEPIEWQVLEVRGNQKLLISKYGIDCRQYDSRDMYLTWEQCQLRNWLNSDFIQTAFTTEAASMISSTSLDNSNNPVYGTWGGNNTVDRVFLLSYNEASVYFPTQNQRMAQATQYTASKNAELKYGNNCWWWLRTPGVYAIDVCGVHHDGELDPKGVFVYGQRSAVRPVMWVTVE